MDGEPDYHIYVNRQKANPGHTNVNLIQVLHFSDSSFIPENSSAFQVLVVDSSAGLVTLFTPRHWNCGGRGGSATVGGGKSNLVDGGGAGQVVGEGGGSKRRRGRDQHVLHTGPGRTEHGALQVREPGPAVDLAHQCHSALIHLPPAARLINIRL